MITLAKESRGLLSADIATSLKVSKAAASQWESGTTEISQPLLEALANLLNYPVSFFYQPGNVLPLPMSYRKRSNVSVVLLNQIDANANIYRLNMEKLMAAINQPKNDLPVLDINEHGTPAACAQELRSIWKLNNGVIANLSEVLETKGILLLAYDFGTDRVDGRCTYTGHAYPTILTNKSLLGDRQRFTLARFLGYLVMHLKTNPALDRDLSHEANLFAAEFLMPQQDIKPDLEGITFAKLGELKPKWKVSMISLLYRADDLGLVTPNQKRYILQQFNEHQIRKREPENLDIPAEPYKLVRNLITTYKQKQEFNVSQLAEFFNLRQDDFLERYNF